MHKPLLPHLLPALHLSSVQANGSIFGVGTAASRNANSLRRSSPSASLAGGTAGQPADQKSAGLSFTSLDQV